MALRASSALGTLNRVSSCDKASLIRPSDIAVWLEPSSRDTISGFLKDTGLVVRRCQQVVEALSDRGMAEDWRRQFDQLSVDELPLARSVRGVARTRRTSCAMSCSSAPRWLIGT